MRLKVIELHDEANQPMSDGATSLTLLYNSKIDKSVEFRRSADPRSTT